MIYIYIYICIYNILYIIYISNIYNIYIYISFMHIYHSTVELIWGWLVFYVLYIWETKKPTHKKSPIFKADSKEISLLPNEVSSWPLGNYDSERKEY